jgi:hypothetical protein
MNFSGIRPSGWIYVKQWDGSKTQKAPVPIGKEQVLFVMDLPLSLRN